MTTMATFIPGKLYKVVHNRTPCWVIPYGKPFTAKWYHNKDNDGAMVMYLRECTIEDFYHADRKEMIIALCGNRVGMVWRGDIVEVET